MRISESEASIDELAAQNAKPKQKTVSEISFRSVLYTAGFVSALQSFRMRASQLAEVANDIVERFVTGNSYVRVFHFFVQ